MVRLHGRKGLLLIVAPGLVVAGLFAGLLLHEWFVIGVRADPATIEGYHFGSEAMLDKGGWHYATPRRYAATALAEGMIGLAFVSAFAAAVIRRSVVLAVCTYAALAVGIAANQKFM